MSYDEAETFLILKYGSLSNAYDAWATMSTAEQAEKFHVQEYEVLMNYEYNHVHTFGYINGEWK